MCKAASNRETLRREHLSRRQRTSPLNQESAAKRLADTLRHAPIHNGETWGVYAAIRGELSLDPFIATHAPTIQWAWPKCHQDGHMDFYVASTTALERGRYGILEPRDGELLAPRVLDGILVPGVAFSPDGGRIGMGGGFYDRYLKTIRQNVPRVGIAYQWQIVRTLPLLPHDIPMTHLATEHGWYTCSDAADGDEFDKCF